ncbi:MAG: gliding motility-associated C-terminal domain-containing protein [Bacteroidota bacterium]
MKNSKVFISILFLLIGVKTIDAQIDSVAIDMEIGVPTRVVNVKGTYFLASDENHFTSEDRTEYVFSWKFDDETFTDTTPAMQYTFNKLGEHTITFFAEELSSGIEFSQTLSITLGASSDVPNVFSPNGDGVNDLFIIPADGFTVYQMTIFSRSGMVVFERKAPVITWDGRNKAGDEVKQGVYYYVLEALDGSSPVKKGFLHLYR